MRKTYLQMTKRNKVFVVVFIVLLVFTIFLWYDVVYAPDYISFVETNVKYEDIFIKKMADDLIIQQYVKGDGVYASRGYDIYFLKENDDTFKRIGRLPIPFGISYLGNSNSARSFINQNEVVEMMRLNSGTIIAFAGGYMFRAESGQSQYTFEITGHIEFFGLDKGRGIMPQGYTEDSSGTIYWGEYWDNFEKKPIRVWKSMDDGRHWEVAYEFLQGEIRHVHAVQYDPYSDVVWIATGDSDAECTIGYLDDADHYVLIGNGSQKWRAVSLVFTEDWIYWGMDGSSIEYPNVEVWRWHREKQETQRCTLVDSYAFYSAVSNGTIIITTDGGGEGASLWVTTDEEHWWNAASFTREKAGHHGTIRVVAGPDGMFYITLHNLEDFNHSLLQILVD